jgi:hypothetical protein
LKPSTHPRLRARRQRQRRCAAEQRDELAAFQLIQWHSIPPARVRLQDIELTRVSQELFGRRSSVISPILVRLARDR